MTEVLHDCLIEFDAENHVYYADGNRVISVTQVLDRVGAVESDFFTEAHRIRGTLVHLLMHMNNTGVVPNMKLDGYPKGAVDEAMPYFDQWKRFKKQVRLEIIAAEETVFDPLHRFAGRIDVRGRIGGEEWILDAKSNVSGYLPAWTKWQTAGYAHAQNPVRPARRACVILTPDRFIGPIEFPPSEYIESRDDFLSMVRAVRAVETLRSE